MILKKIYSEPEGLFKTTVFNNGLNFIYGRKEPNSPKNSLNSIGKSTFLDLIDFCLLSSFQKQHNPRLFSALDILRNFSAVLEFEVSNVEYIIKRSFDTPNEVLFGTEGNLSFYKIDDLKKILFDIIFRRENYNGIQNPSWYRNLISFYIKIQKFKKPGFLDPIKYIQELTEVQLNIFHFFLLGIDNTIPNNLFKFRVDGKDLSTSIKEIKKYVEEKYGLKDISKAQNEINRLKVDISKLDNAISVFKLGEHYDDAENEANELTESIKNHIYNNFLDKEKIKSYEDSYQINDELNMRRISSMYKEINENLALNIKKTLKDAVDFRKKLSESRKDFIKKEIEKLRGVISLRDEILKELEEKRAKLFYFLSAKEAIKDLTEAFFIVSEKKAKLSEIESNIKLLLDLTREFNEIETEINKLKNEYIVLLEEVSDDIVKFYKIFNETFDAIYLENKSSSQFAISTYPKKDSLVQISISMPDMFGKGKNQGRTLIYDIAVAILNIEKTHNYPRFLIHDGIFDGVDKAHFISVCELIESLNMSGVPFQYITTINEEGTLSADKFGTENYVDPNYIEDRAIITLSNSRKLFNTNF
ncbi:DUF2326 domain-containing protein [Elizabethkingia anophelis]|nr:DUF2326 domain-containing protein [Elizabethkingia anophelis]